MDTAKLDEIERLLGLATAGEWEVHPHKAYEYGPPSYCSHAITAPYDGDQVATIISDSIDEHEANAALIVALRNNAADLVRAARRLAAAEQACVTFCEWLDREERGSEGQPWKGLRDTPDGERQWREWWNENLSLCALAQEQARAVVAAIAEESRREG